MFGSEPRVKSSSVVGISSLLADLCVCLLAFFLLDVRLGGLFGHSRGEYIYKVIIFSVSFFPHFSISLDFFFFFVSNVGSCFEIWDVMRMCFFFVIFFFFFSLSREELTFPSRSLTSRPPRTVSHPTASLILLLISSHGPPPPAPPYPFTSPTPPPFHISPQPISNSPLDLPTPYIISHPTS